MDEDVVEIENVENVCRLCLCTDEPRASVFETDKQEDSAAVPLAVKIQACLSIEISATDKLSTLICEECVKNINQWHTYRESCLRSQNKLQKWLTSHLKPTFVTIKGEPVDLDYEDNIEIISEVTKNQESSNLSVHTVEESETSNEQIQNISDHIDEDDDDNSVNNADQPLEPETIPSVAEKETDKDESQTEDQQDPLLMRPIKSEPLDDYDTDCTVELESADDNELLLNPMALGTKEDVVMEADSTQKSTGAASSATQKKKLRRGPHTHFRGTRVFKQKCVYCQIFLHSKYSYMKHMKRFHSNKNNGTENSESQNEEEEMVEDLEEELISMEKESPLTQVQQDIISQLKTFSCYKCQQSFNDRRSTLSHIRQHLPDLRPHTCVACLTQFSDRSMYQSHCSASFECAMKIALVEPKQGNERYFTCNMCLRSLQGRKELLSHLTMHSNKQYEEMISPARPPPKLKPMAPLPSPNDEAANKSSLPQRSGPYKNGDPAHNHKCDLCGMIYRYRPNMIKHKQLCMRLQPEVRTSYKCAHCSMTFLVFKKFHSHVTVNHKKKEFTCAICNSRFRSPSDFLSHHERHRVSAIRQTQQNNDKSLQNAQSPLKERNVHGADAKQAKTRASGQRYTCALCNKTFSTRFELTEHRNLHLKVKIYSCAICRSMFSSAGALEIHMREHGIDDPNERDANVSCVEYGSLDEDVRIENDSMSAGAASDPGMQGYECKQCKRVLSSFANLRRHTTIAHRNSKEYECSDCTKIFTRKELYEQHVLHEHKSSKNMFHCPECPKSFVFQTNFRYHFRTAHLEKSQDGYSCDICGKVFAEEASLKIHKGWHNRANSRFNTMLILGKQKSPSDSQKSPSAGETNSPERPARARKSFPNPPSQSPTKSPGSFQCQVCNDKFNDVTELRTHLWDVHCARNKPEKSISNDELQCELCTNVFPDKDILAAHMKWHKANPILNDVHTTYTCDVCNKSYSSKKVLWKHKRLHKATLVTSAKFQSLVKKPVNPFFCTICRKAFSSGQSLQRHKLNFHSDLQNQQPRAQPLYNSNRRLSLEEEPKLKRMKVEVDDSPPKLPPFAMDFAGEVKKKSFMCHLCKKIFPNMSVLYKHKQAVHKPHIGKDGLPECRPVTTEDGRFLCNVCSKEFPGLPNLRQHFTIKHKKIYDSDKYQCNVSSCEQAFPTPDSLKDHEQTHTNMMFSCKLCDRYLFNKESMIDHIINVHNTAYQPDNKTFHREIDLTTYVVKGATGATCPRCSVKYPNNRAMKIHYVKIHENE